MTLEIEIDIDAVRRAAGATRDPEIRRTLAEMDLLDEVEISGSRVTVYFHLTSPLCPSRFATMIGRDLKKRVEAVPGVTACEVVIQDHFLREKIQALINAGGNK
jgi:metal-sulfur cluster biosynthetic enzyme